ncbi:M16 family metallopeptidase [Planctomycetaceae bacterium SH139]
MSNQPTASDAGTYHCVLPCGLTLLGQTMPWLRSASFALVLPAGTQFEPADRYGLASIVCEMVQRGAGPHSSRDVVNLSDNLGMERSASVTTAHTVFGGSMPAESLFPALDLYTEVVRRPHIPANQLEDARNVSLQELRASEDEPVQRVMMRLKELQYGLPLGHSPLGNAAGIASIDSQHVREFYEGFYRPSGAILSVAGKFDWDALVEHAHELFAGWPAGKIGEPPQAAGQAGYEHITHPSQQTHIGFAFPTLPYEHANYFTLRAALGVLSDGMSSRLFDRVREQRGLCYTISAGTHSLRGTGAVFGYAGTTPERAQETLDVTWQEIRQLGDTVELDELERFKVRIQSNLVMQQESSASRASSMATDWYYLGRVLQPAEIEAQVDAVTPARIAELWSQLDLAAQRIVTFGPEPLKV